MLLDPQGNKLGDKNLKDYDAVAKIREDNRKLTDKHKIPNQAILEDREAAIGVAMAPATFIQRLQKLPGVIVEPGGVPNAVAVRATVLDGDPESPTNGTYIKKYISGFFTNQIMPEWSYLILDKNGIPTREVRGWRTVLLALFHSRICTYPQLKAAFGEPNGQRNVLWREQTQAAR